MTQIKTAADVAELGTILFVGAHPDDETFTAAGILAAAVANGQRVACITATRGEAGSRDERRWPLATLGDVREREQLAALGVLGVHEQHWMGYLDGECDQVDEREAVRRLRDEVMRCSPDTILTFGPEGLTGHPDHQMVSQWTDQAVDLEGSRIRIYHAVTATDQYASLKQADETLNIYFNIDRPRLVAPDKCDIYFELPSRELELKYRALAAIPSQFEPLLEVVAPDGVLNGGLSVECFVTA